MGEQLKPFMLMARLLIKSKEKVKVEVNHLKEVGKFENEQDQCGSYCAMTPHEGDKTVVTVFEAYDHKDYLMNDHRNSEPYKKLQSAVAKEDTRAKPVEAQFYKPRGGFLSREQPPSLPLDDQFIWIANFKAKPGKRDELMDVVLTHTKNVERDEKDTSSFLVLEKTDDDVSICLFERYTSEEYFKTTHVTSNSMQEFRSKFPTLIDERVSGGFQAKAGFIDKREKLLYPAAGKRLGSIKQHDRTLTDQPATSTYI